MSKPQLTDLHLCIGETVIIRVKNWVITDMGPNYIIHMCKNNLRPHRTASPIVSYNGDASPIVSYNGDLRCPHCRRIVPDLVLVTYALIIGETYE
jgi:hypothetical protein